jgi:hypothetical protein
MKRSILSVLALLFLMTAVPASAVVETQLVLDDGTGNVATIQVQTGALAPNCIGACAGLTTQITTGEHKLLLVSGTLGQFNINAQGFGDLATVEPTLQNFNQLEAATKGKGTLIAIFSDTDYTTLGIPTGAFELSASITNDAQIVNSTTDFQAYADAGNGIRADLTGALIGEFLDRTGNTPVTRTGFGIFASPIIGSSGSLTTFTRIDFTGAGSVQANFTIANAIPEPTSVVLFGTLLLGTGVALRRKFGK